ncbi:MAG TPA: zf-TFIIB domain-containing protein [Actinomycetota bacterium]|nr:zf-TFIIB domain-containing protein [Actinomycetota bacterium]
MATDLVCPKCQGLMRTYERSGVTLDQCAECRGIFLDRGELEHLVDAEQGWQRGHSAPRERERDRSYERERDRGPSIPNPFKDHDDDDYDRRRYSEGSHKRRKKSFFDELFD